MTDKPAGEAMDAERDDGVQMMLTGTGYHFDGGWQSITVRTNRTDDTKTLKQINLDGRWYIPVDYPNTPGKCPACKAITTPQAGNSRDEVLEEAAKIADKRWNEWKNAGGFEGHTSAARIIGSEIRALASKKA